MPFGSPIVELPRTSLAGIDVYVHDDGTSQVLFLELPKGREATVVPTHTHGVEWGIVVEGAIEMTIDGRVELHAAGTSHLIPADVPHSFRFHPGTSSIHCFGERRVALPTR
ncbi:MAG: cupin domain-containing protein [Thermoplasmata archaeon]|jgi:quercetin dioxygenase-like cupin family protein|nr:cupin domain-containing protein [Thermoplasmata archaeon]